MSSWRGRYRLLGPVLAAALALAAAAPTHADVFGPIGLLSSGTIGAGELQQAEYAHAAEISSNGQYLVFEGSVGGSAGVWRLNLATRQFQQVAGGDGERPGLGEGLYAARLPSVSADGRYVSFTSNEGSRQLEARTRGPGGEPGGGGGEPEPAGSDQVYVRDMEAAPNQPGAFVLASAVNGSSEALTYSESDHQHGSVAAAASAISADGQEVAFVTTATSDLAGSNTPPLQVAVRRLATQETILVSGEYEPATGATSDRPVSGKGFGAVYVREPGSLKDALTEQGPEYTGWKEAGIDRPPGASISADGTTVAWMGQNIGLQAPTLSGEHPDPGYSEPLWRRLQAPATATERVTGGSDPSNPACAESGQARLPQPPPSGDPCQGPFVTFPEAAETVELRGIFSSFQQADNSAGDPIPRLSGDGSRVAFLSRAEPTTAVLEGGPFVALRDEGEPADLYVADIHPGLTRAAALTALTALGGESNPETAPISEFAISEDGTHVAFTTVRTQFRLADPAYVSAATSEVGLNELFDVNLADGTLTRVTHGLDGEPSEQLHEPKGPGEETAYKVHPTAGATSPSFAQDGALLAFASTASNLVAGDGNSPTREGGIPSYNLENVGERDGSDAFVIERQAPVELPTPQSISPQPPTSTEPAWDLSATALSRTDGSVVLYVRTPGPGSLRASARASVLVAAGGQSARRRGRRSQAHRRLQAALRTVATAGKSTLATDGELLTVVLRPAAAYAALAQRRGGLSAEVRLQFAATGHPALTQSLPVTFLRKASAAHRAKRARRTRRGRR
jgi:hypothetical protein